MAFITLANGGQAVIDDQAFDLVNRYRWCETSRGYVATSLWVDGKKPILFMHRLVMDSPAGMHVDHINHNKLDNRRSNLRTCTNMQNQWNSSKHIDNTSGHKGVSWSKSEKKWQVLIQHNKNRKHLGFFNDKELAAKAYNKAALRLFGNFANLNEVNTI